MDMFEIFDSKIKARMDFDGTEKIEGIKEGETVMQAVDRQGEEIALRMIARFKKKRQYRKDNFDNGDVIDIEESESVEMKVLKG